MSGINVKRRRVQVPWPGRIARLLAWWRGLCHKPAVPVPAPQTAEELHAAALAGVTILYTFPPVRLEDVRL